MPCAELTAPPLCEPRPGPPAPPQKGQLPLCILLATRQHLQGEGRQVDQLPLNEGQLPLCILLATRQHLQGEGRQVDQLPLNEGQLPPRPKPKFVFRWIAADLHTGDRR